MFLSNLQSGLRMWSMSVHDIPTVPVVEVVGIPAAVSQGPRTAGPVILCLFSQTTLVRPVMDCWTFYSFPFIFSDNDACSTAIGSEWLVWSTITCLTKIIKSIVFFSYCLIGFLYEGTFFNPLRPRRMWYFLF